MNKERFLNRNELILLVSLFTAALLVRLYFIPFYRVISADGVGYVSAARNLINGNFAPLTTYGVIYPSLTAMVSLLDVDTESAGRLVSAVMGSLLIFPLYLLARDFFERSIGIIAAFS
ncbi:glycosyltransferase family 39 protein [Geotalea toluenoxydans]|uniref:glycosyltransferase family 39 protein n=1 Tax=Geotalea toluenoxydans TaxID=421624 RepID=UPI000AFF97BB|nr:glycosyltransferase family 39 protein [Geotalea toluenoxydans]